MQPTKRESSSVHTPVTNQQEAALLVRIANQDRQAFEALYRNYYRRLWRFLEPLTRRPQLIDEILDDTMLVVWMKAATFNGASRVSTWIFAIAYNKALKALKREGRWHQGVLPPSFVEFADTPETELIERASRLAVKRLVGGLSAEQRAVVELTYYHGCGYKEIAEITGAGEHHQNPHVPRTPQAQGQLDGERWRLVPESREDS
jgi:RNA polymerase sigma factor (sigma-70 family)